PHALLELGDDLVGDAAIEIGSLVGLLPAHVETSVSRSRPSRPATAVRMPGCKGRPAPDRAATQVEDGNAVAGRREPGRT
ncbi:hypothetical protein, partial [Rhizobium favelukesii]|uniref:hypothetical protein n=1 Tax=Rhizobium favelukesii TaxID=348824 RepID=UPI001AEBFCF4